MLILWNFAGRFIRMSWMRYIGIICLGGIINVFIRLCNGLFLFGCLIKKEKSRDNFDGKESSNFECTFVLG